MQRLLFPLLLALPFPAQAQMYTWREGASMKYSNSPPPWYRLYEPVRGPRVLVTHGRTLVDDTGLPMEERQRMRPALRPQPSATLRVPIRN